MGYKMERRIAAILLMLLFLGMGLYGLRGSSADHALAKPPPSPRLDAPWSGNVRVNDETAEDQWLSAIAVDASGNAYAVWEDYRNGERGPRGPYLNGDIYFSYRPADGSWGPNVRVNDDAGTENQRWPAIAVDSSDNAYAVWQDWRNCDYDIYFSYRPAGGNWGANVKVNDVSGPWRGHWFPDIAVDSWGNAYAVWADGRNANWGIYKWDIYFSYRPAGGSWGANVKVNDDAGTEHHRNPAIAVDSWGTAYAVWQDSRNGDRDIYFSYRPAGGSFGANIKVNDDAGTEDQWSPAIGVDSWGNAYAVWQDDRNGYGEGDVYFSYRPAGGNWGTNVKVNDGPGAPHGLPSAVPGPPAIAVDASGNAYAVWMDGDYDISSSYRAAGRSWWPSVKVNDDPDRALQAYPAIAVDSSGNAYAVWQDDRNGDSDIYFSFYRLWRQYFPIIMKNY